MQFAFAANNMNSVPFRITGVLTDFADSEGIARLGLNSLVLEFQVKDNLFGLFKSAPREVHIPFSDLAEAVFKRGIFRGVLTVRARRLSAMASVPGLKESELRLGCRRRHWEAAAQLASGLNMRIIAHDLNQMAEGGRPPSPCP